MRSVAVLVVVCLVLAVFGPMLAPHDPTAISIPNRLRPPGGNGFWGPMLWAAISSQGFCTGRAGLWDWHLWCRFLV